MVVGAMGAFMAIMVVLIPNYGKTSKTVCEDTAALRQELSDARRQLQENQLALQRQQAPLMQPSTQEKPICKKDSATPVSLSLVVDASGSMATPMNPDSATKRVIDDFEGCMHRNLYSANDSCNQEYDRWIAAIQSAQGPTRLDTAKQALSSLFGRLPEDTGVGLTVLTTCPSAMDYGFFEPNMRQQLVQTVLGLEPTAGTPLSDGIEKAAERLDGVGRAGLMVVVSDGQDSCQRDPCALAESIKRSKPLLKINVVDIGANGAVNCLAEKTGGKVLTVNQVNDVQSMLREATSDIRSSCR